MNSYETEECFRFFILFGPQLFYVRPVNKIIRLYHMAYLPKRYLKKKLSVASRTYRLQSTYQGRFINPLINVESFNFQE